MQLTQVIIVLFVLACSLQYFLRHKPLGILKVLTNQIIVYVPARGIGQHSVRQLELIVRLRLFGRRVDLKMQCGINLVKLALNVIEGAVWRELQALVEGGGLEHLVDDVAF